MSEQFLNLSLSANSALFALFAAIIWFTGSFLTKLADRLSDRLNLARSTMGLVFLALATSLPEVATTLSAAVEQNADLVLNNLFGGIALQTAILALADFWARGAITNYPRRIDHLLEATILTILLSLLLALIILEEPLQIAHLGFGSLLIAAIYAGAIYLLRRHDTSEDWVPVDLPSEEIEPALGIAQAELENWSTGRLLAASALACIVIFLVGSAIVFSAEALATQSGLGAGFIGVTVLALATSLPELSTTISAVRMGAYTLAISNIFGSNLIMIVLVLPADALFTGGPILRASGASVKVATIAGLLVTTIFLLGLMVRRKPKIWRFGADSILVLITYTLALVALYSLV